MTELRVVVPDDVAERLTERAQQQHTTPEALAGEAVVSYLGPAPSTPRRISFIGIGHSGRSDVSERAEEILNEHFGQ